jgi:hypothetical protein
VIEKSTVESEGLTFLDNSQIVIKLGSIEPRHDPDSQLNRECFHARVMFDRKRVI